MMIAFITFLSVILSVLGNKDGFNLGIRDSIMIAHSFKGLA